MSEEERITEREAHKKFAVNAFNLTWNLLDKKERTSEEDDQMVNAAHASRFHWGEIGTPLEFEWGEWQISRVYSVLNRSEEAKHHARRCLDICKKNHIGDFDIAFAYEAMARSAAIAGQSEEAEKYIQLAREAGEKIEEQGNKDYFLDELNTVPGQQE
jgi:tetratricopeptide (TPR) repeat protein